MLSQLAAFAPSPEGDPTSADILHTILEGREKQRWMFTAKLRHVAD